MRAEEISERLSRIRGKLQHLRSVDASLKQYGAKSHGYRLGPPLGEAQLQHYERQHEVELPYEYRRFLMEVGHGGAGPINGLFSLDSEDPECLNMYGGDLEKPFPWTSSFNPDRWQRGGDIGDVEDVEWDSDGNYVGMFLPGALYLCHLGCAIRNFLVVSGPCKGEVWRDDQASRKEIYPEVDEDGNRLRFLDWYEQWLDQSLEGRFAL
jgi:hypothetical protein